MTARDDHILAGIARSLARLRWVPTGVLAEIVTEGGACMQVSADDGPPRWLHQAGSDRELAARLCAAARSSGSAWSWSYGCSAIRPSGCGVR